MGALMTRFERDAMRVFKGLDAGARGSPRLIRGGLGACGARAEEARVDASTQTSNGFFCLFIALFVVFHGLFKAFLKAFHCLFKAFSLLFTYLFTEERGSNKGAVGEDHGGAKAGAREVEAQGLCRGGPQAPLGRESLSSERSFCHMTST